MKLCPRCSSTLLYTDIDRGVVCGACGWAPAVTPLPYVPNHILRGGSPQSFTAETHERLVAGARKGGSAPRMKT